MPPANTNPKSAAERLAEAERIATRWATAADRLRAQIAARREAMRQARTKAAESPTRGRLAAGWFAGWERQSVAIAAATAALVRAEARIAPAEDRVIAARATLARAERLAPLKAQLIARAGAIALAAPVVTKRWRAERKAEPKKVRARAKELAKRICGEVQPEPARPKRGKGARVEADAVLGLPAAETWPTGPVVPAAELVQQTRPPRDDLLPGEYRIVGQLLDTFSGARKPLLWTADHVGARLAEAFRTLRRLPMTVRPKGYAALWPAYVHEVAEEPRTAAAADVGRERLGTTPDDLSRMHEALSWPMEYLGHDTELARAVNMWALSNGADPDEQPDDCVRDGLLTIAVGLSRKKAEIR